MAITPFLNAPTTTSTKAQATFDFVLFISGASGPFTLENVQVQVQPSGTKGTGIYPAAAFPNSLDVKAPWQGTNIIGSQTASYSFAVTPFAPISGVTGVDNLAGTAVYGVTCICRESTTPAIVSSNTVYITASSVSP